MNDEEQKQTNITFYDLLKAVYQIGNNEEIYECGYELNKDLSNDNVCVFFNTTEKMVLFGVAGTKSWYDVLIDIYIFFSRNIQNTSRYIEAETIFEKSKRIYEGYKFVLFGHSLSGSIVGILPTDKKMDRVYTFNKYALPFGKTKLNETPYRIEGDIVSIFNKNSKHMITIETTEEKNIYTAHSIVNLKNLNIVI